MDPYLERHWRAVHQRLVTYACDQLQPKLPQGLRADLEERVFVEADGELGRIVYPDVHVVERRAQGGASSAPRVLAESGLAVREPIVVQVESEPIRQGSIEIVDLTSGRRVITVIEFLSPANKVPGEGQDLFLKKQREMREAGVSLVEIDLTRAGKRVMVLPPLRIPPSHRTLYQVCVRRGYRPSHVEVYRVPLEEPLPAIRIPLREKEPDVVLELQPLLSQAYLNGRYDDIDYRAEPDPPLPEPEARWASELLRSQGLR
jgi:hypothetical protein